MSRFTKGTWLNRRQEEIFKTVGEQFHLARLRRNLTIEQAASRMLVSRNTVAKIEKGDPSVSIGIYSKYLYVLQLEDDLLCLAADDKMGRLMQDLELKQKKRATKKQ